jgi:hypothetical protein
MEKEGDGIMHDVVGAEIMEVVTTRDEHDQEALVSMILLRVRCDRRYGKDKCRSDQI